MATTIQGLSARGHQIALLAELPPSPSREPITGMPDVWCVHPDGEAQALRRAREWRPDVIYVQGLDSLELERALIEIAPAVLFPHSYEGLCISGSRTWQATGTLCTRSLGPGCLLKYFPNRCGGRSPVTMWRDFTKQRGRQNLHAAYRAIVVASWHMAAMYAESGITHRVHVLPVPIPAPVTAARRERATPIVMVYAGRLERLKGVQLLIDAAQLACTTLGIPGELSFAGDGPLRASLTRDAQHATGGALRVHLQGWLDEGARDALLARADLVLVPSLWPEPFGRIGLEAGRFGVPAVGFASGGIPEWLRDGVNGTIASEKSAAGLAEAIVRCAGDQGTYRRLSEGAIAAVSGGSTQAHVAALERILHEASR